MKTIIMAALCIIAACKASTFHSGTYRVAYAKTFRNRSVVKLEGIQKEFIFPSDTLKKGDHVYISTRPNNMVAFGDRR